MRSGKINAVPGRHLLVQLPHAGTACCPAAQAPDVRSRRVFSAQSAECVLGSVAKTKLPGPD